MLNWQTYSVDLLISIWMVKRWFFGVVNGSLFFILNDSKPMLFLLGVRTHSLNGGQTSEVFQDEVNTYMVLQWCEAGQVDQFV